MSEERGNGAQGGDHNPLEDVLKKLGDHLKGGGFFQTASAGVRPEPEDEVGAEPPTETVIGGFRLIKPLGRGGMGQVWEAEELAIGRRVALKLLHPHIEFSTKGLERFEREAQAGGKLSHPGIVQVLSVGESDGRHYMAQELVLGSITLADSLGSFRDGDELPVGYYRRIAALFVRIGRSLTHAHEHGVVHRDIKPSNILIGADDQPKIADFGLAMLEDGLSLSRTGEFMGTPYYMSPEQAASKRMGIDHRTDIFSLGVTLYEALTLTRPFNGDTSAQVFQQILLIDPPDPKQLRSRVPDDLAVICLKALEKLPEHRYETMAVFVEDLERFLSDRPILAKPPSAVQRTLKWVRRNPTKSAVTTVAVVAFAVISWLLVIVAEQKVQLEDQNASLEDTNQEIKEEVKEVAEEKVQIIDTLYLATIREAQRAIKNYDISNVGPSLKAMRNIGSTMWEWRWAYLSTQISDVLFEGQSAAMSVCVHPDGDKFVSSFLDGDLVMWQQDGTPIKKFSRPNDVRVNCVAMTPNGRYLAGGTNPAKGASRGSVYVWDCDTGELVASLEGCHPQAVRCLNFSPDGAWLVSGSAMNKDDEAAKEELLLRWETKAWSSLRGEEEW